MLEKIFRFAPWVAVLGMSASLGAQTYQGECARAGQVFAAMDMSAMVQNNVFKGYEIQPATGGRACFKIAFYDIRLNSKSFEDANFTYKSREMWGETTDSECGIQFRVVAPQNIKKDTTFYGEMKLKKMYMSNPDGTCSVKLRINWTRKSTNFPALNQSQYRDADYWNVYKGKLISVDFPRFIHMEIE